MIEPVPFVTDIHCSSLPQWAVCEQSQIYMLKYPEAPPARGEHVAGWMGSCIHAFIAGEAPPPPPNAVVLDRITPTMAVAHQQIEAMAEAIEIAMDREGWYVGRQEYEPAPFSSSLARGVRLVGRIDMRLVGPGKSALVDLKTSADFRAAWLQLGGYDLLDPADMLGTIHCPRPPNLIDEPVATFHYNEKPAAAVAQQSLRVLVRAAELLQDDSNAIAAPGNRCRHCPNEACFVRSVGHVPNL